jgi:hypothetical protein
MVKPPKKRLVSSRHHGRDLKSQPQAEGLAAEIEIGGKPQFSRGWAAIPVTIPKHELCFSYRRLVYSEGNRGAAAGIMDGNAHDDTGS